MAKYKIQLVADDCELLHTIEVDTEEMNWDTSASIQSDGFEIYDEIRRAELRSKE